MNLPIALLSTDFDGTLFAEFENPPIPDELLGLIHGLQRRGAKWIINTGRDMSSLMEALARGGVGVEPDYLVLVEREIHEHDGSQYVALDEWNVACARQHAELFARVQADLPRILDWINARFHARIYEDPYSPFCLIAADNGDMDTIHEYLENYCRTIPYLSLVRNDLPMLSLGYAALLAAPENAVPEVKAAVRRQGGYVSERCRGNGVAEAIKYYLGVKTL